MRRDGRLAFYVNRSKLTNFRCLAAPTRTTSSTTSRPGRNSAVNKSDGKRSCRLRRQRCRLWRRSLRVGQHSLHTACRTDTRSTALEQEITQALEADQFSVGPDLLQTLINAIREAEDELKVRDK